MSEPIKQCTRKPFGAKDLGPFLKGQVRGDHEAMMLIGPTDDFKEQFSSSLGERNVSQFIDDQQMESLELFVHSLKSFFLPALHELSNQVGSGIEANGPTLGTGRKGQGRDKMGFTGSRVSDE